MTNHEEFLKASKIIPGGVNSPVRAFANVGGEPFIALRGSGAYIEDIEGRKYLDFVQSWGPLIFGHCDAKIESAVIKAVQNGLSFGMPNLDETRLAELILEDYDFLDKIRFVSSGTEATMSAIRVGRAFSGRDGVIKFEGCYHGHSDSLLFSAGSGAATFGKPSSDGIPADITKNTHLAVYNDFQSVKEIVNSHEIGVIIVEPIAGNMGFVPADAEFLSALRKICDEHKIVLIFDEVMSGYRASRTGAYGIYGIKSDMVTFGKVIGGGLNVAAFAGRGEIMDMLSPIGGVYQAGTLSGNPVAMAAGIASLSQIRAKSGLYDRLDELARMFVDGLKELANERGIALCAQNIGSMFGYFFNENKVKNYADAKRSDTKIFAKFHREMLNLGVFLAPSQFETGFVCEAMSKSDIESALDCAKKSFGKI